MSGAGSSRPETSSAWLTPNSDYCEVLGTEQSLFPLDELAQGVDQKRLLIVGNESRCSSGSGEGHSTGLGCRGSRRLDHHVEAVGVKCKGSGHRIAAGSVERGCA